jgi:hypothetical protein
MGCAADVTGKAGQESLGTPPEKLRHYLTSKAAVIAMLAECYLRAQLLSRSRLADENGSLSLFRDFC